MIGSRSSSHFSTPDCRDCRCFRGWPYAGASSADLHERVGNEFVGRQHQVLGRRTFADAAGGVVDSSRGTGRTSRRYSPDSPTGMQPRCVQLAIMISHCSWPSLVRCSSVSGSLRSLSGTASRFLDLGGGAVAHEDRQAAPLDGDRLALGDRREVELDGGEREDRAIGVHLVDERPDDGGDADRADGSRRDIEEIPPRRLYCCLFCQDFSSPSEINLVSRGAASLAAAPRDLATPTREAWKSAFFLHCHKDLSSAEGRLSRHLRHYTHGVVCARHEPKPGAVPRDGGSRSGKTKEPGTRPGSEL